MNSTIQEAKFICLSTIALKTNSQWNIFTEQQKSRLRNIYFGLLCDYPTKNTPLPILRQLNNVLIQILFKDLPPNWPSFISDMINSSSNNPTNMLNTIFLFRNLYIRMGWLEIHRRRQNIRLLLRKFDTVPCFQDSSPQMPFGCCIERNRHHQSTQCFTLPEVHLHSFLRHRDAC